MSSVNEIVQRALITYHGLTTTTRAAIAISLAVILYRLLFRQEPPKHKELPAWAPIELGIVISLLSGTREGIVYRIYSKLRRYSGSFWGLSSVNQTLIRYEDVDRLFSSKMAHAVSIEWHGYYLFLRFFGLPDTPELKRKVDTMFKPWHSPIERVFNNETHATEALERANIPKMVAEFVTFSQDREQMTRWERVADTKVIIPENMPGQNAALEANLSALIVDFGASVTIPPIFGRDLLDRNPQLEEDLWKFDRVIPFLFINLPEWLPFKVMKEGLEARKRLLDEVEAFSRRVTQFQRGEEVDDGADMSDVSDVFLERNKAFERDGWSYRERAASQLLALLASNANTQPVLFWLILYIYSTPGLADSLRKEVAPFITLSDCPENDNNTKIVTAIDNFHLSRECQLLKSVIFETMRLAFGAVSSCRVKKPITLKDGDHVHQLYPGTFLSVPHGFAQRDPSLYPDPDKFVPDRFLETDPASGKLVARYGKLRPWGAGLSICRGRVFAEKEMMAIAASLVMVWDISPAGGGEWKVPEMVGGPGPSKPKEDVRVEIRRRVFGGASEDGK
ncbi:cytochrome P450 [Sordaria brevicollis]|uniref:Cytochrome P450 n=1 Tax=Sordaria brevicollis TaxID=83679 RepID=A0AAE0PK58_SORBR|nr:cytochrome P450 [Sordaria brevicollis]